MNCHSSNFALRTMLVIGLLSALIGCTTIATQQPTPPPAQSSELAPPPASSKTATLERSTSDPYKGDLSIFEDPQREQKLQIGRVMDILGIKEDSQVADIGAGSGWFTVRAARRVGNSGAVYAVEINQDYLKHIEARTAAEAIFVLRRLIRGAVFLRFL